jgi:hypothetical protein
MERETAQNLMPRFLNAITAMAQEPGAIHARLPAAVLQVTAFSERHFPEELRPKYVELLHLFSSVSVPIGAENHPDWRKTVPAYYLSPTKTRRAAALLVELLEAIVYVLESP